MPRKRAQGLDSLEDQISTLLGNTTEKYEDKIRELEEQLEVQQRVIAEQGEMLKKVEDITRFFDPSYQVKRTFKLDEEIARFITPICQRHQIDIEAFINDQIAMLYQNNAFYYDLERGDIHRRSENRADKRGI